MQRLESSQIKARQMKNVMESMEDERRKIQVERELLLAEQNQESEQWKKKYNDMTRKNDEIVANLAQANQCYLNQVSENEKLSGQIEQLQGQHREMIAKFNDLQQKLMDSEKMVEEQRSRLLEESGRHATTSSPVKSPSKSIVVEEQSLHKVEQAFNS